MWRETTNNDLYMIVHFHKRPILAHSRDERYEEAYRADALSAV